PGGAQVRQGRLGDLYDTEEVDLHRGPYVLDGALLDRADLPGAGVVDDRVQAAVFGDHLVDARRDGRRVDHVQPLDLYAVGAGRGPQQGLGLAGVAHGGDDGPAAAGGGDGGGQADPRGGAGDQDGVRRGHGGFLRRPLAGERSR